MLALSLSHRRVVEAGDRQPVLIVFVGQRHAVVGLRQELVEDPERRPVVVVAHVLAQGASPVTLGEHVLGPADRQRRDRLDENPRANPRAASVS